MKKLCLLPHAREEDPHHLFIVHSPLAFLMMNLIARKLEIDPKLIGIALVRHQVGMDTLLRNLGIKSFFADPLLTSYFSFAERSRKLAIRQFDREIRKLFGGKTFNLYTFDSVSGINQLASTHSHCASVFIFEEGVGNMRPIQEQIEDHVINATKQPLFVGRTEKRFFSTGLVSSRVDGFFSFSRLAFPDTKSTNVFDRELIKSFAQEEAVELLVLIPNYRNLDDGALKQRLSELLGGKAQSSMKVSLKFHPDNTKEEEKYWLDVFRDLRIEANVLCRSTYVVEANLLAGKIGEIVGWSSSALVYAKEFGVKSLDLDKSDSSSQ